MFESPTTSSSSPRQSFGGSSNSAIRRSSLIHQKQQWDEGLNDDDAERSSLVVSEMAVSTSSPVRSPSSRWSGEIMSSPQNAHFQDCLKLYAENKINKENSWKLRLIDFMSNMMRCHDSRMDNLQTASTVVDASARIYSFRIDGLHENVLKMAGGLSKVAQAKRGKNNDGCTQVEGAADGEPAAGKKNKKSSRRPIVANPDVLNGDFDKIDFKDPFLERLAAIRGEVTSSHRSFNATLPIDDNTLGLLLRTDKPFLEPIEENTNKEIDLTDKVTLPVKLFPAFRETDQICKPFTGFSISNWNPETETEETDESDLNSWVENNWLNLSQQDMAFDVNAVVEPIPQEDNNLFNGDPLPGIESDEEADAAVAALASEARSTATTGHAVLTDMRPNHATDARLEYAYCSIVGAWAGPAHWKLKFNNRVQQAERTQTTAGGRKKSVRTKPQLDFMRAGLAFDCRAQPAGDYEPVPPTKLVLSIRTLVKGRAWQEARHKTTFDRGLDESHFRKLFTRERVVLQRRAATPAAPADTAGVEYQQPAIATATDYDYNNENDTSYCVNTHCNTNENHWDNEDGGLAAGGSNEQMQETEVAELGELVSPPPRIPKVFIPHATRAKQLDMKQLKRCTWETLTEKSQECEEDDVEPTTFFDIYKKLPKKLKPNMRKSLSVPLVLLSVLQLAGEKGLILESKDDLSDIDIVGLNKK